MQVTESDIAVVAKTKRILAFDLIRGLFLVVIMVDHVELYPSGWDIFTGKGRLWVSAAEGFFFLSGLLIGMIYKRRLHLGTKFIFRKMWRRALQLYIVGTSLTFLFLAWVVFTHHAPIKDTLPMPFPWHQYLWPIFNTHFTYGWADFLIHFVILMLFAPFVFWLVARRKWWLALALMLTAWLFRGTSFNLAWQLIFYGGLIVGFYWHELENSWHKLKSGQQKIIKRTVAGVAGVTFVASYASVYALSLLFYLWGDGLLPNWLQHVAYTWGNWNHDVWLYADKWTVGPFRIMLFVLWFATLYWLVRRYENQINRYTRGILELLGRNSLFVYTVEAFIIFTLKMYFIPPTTNFWQNFAITTIGLAVLVAITKYYRVLMEQYGLAERAKGKALNIKNSLKLSFEKS